MPRPFKYPPELRERAVRLVFEMRERTGERQRIAELERENRELRRANEGVRDAQALGGQGARP